MLRDEHEAVMDALSTDEPEILNSAEGAMHSMNMDTTAEELYFLDDNPFFRGE